MRKKQTTDKRPFSASRRRLLFGCTKEPPKPVYPPWSHDIEKHCTHCGDCVDQCPQQILSLNAENLPVVDFHKNECTFCQNCVQACTAGVFDQTLSPAWHLQVEIGDTCLLKQAVYCRSCGDVCPERAIFFIPRSGYSTDISLDTNLCNGCGACAFACPAGAIEICGA